MEREVESRKWAIYTAPIARTPMSSKGGNSLSRYSKRLLKVLENSLPWVAEKRREEIRERLKKDPDSKVTVVEQ